MSSDLKYAVRQLVKRPWLSGISILMLSVGIGVTTGIFSIFQQILIQPLPVPAPGRLVNLREVGPKQGLLLCGGGGVCDLEYMFSYPVLRTLEAEQNVFTGIAAHHSGFDANLIYEDGQALKASGALVSGSYFGVLDVKPALGRLITAEDAERPGVSAVVVLSHDYWQSHFGGTDVLGRTLTVNGEPLTIIGVAPPGFFGTSIGIRPKVFIPLTMRALMEPNALPFELGSPQDGLVDFLNIFARLAPGVSIEQASAGIDVVHRGIIEEEAAANAFQTEEELRQRRLVLEPGARGLSSFPDTAAQPLSLLMGITVLVLLIVCVNIANLMLARGAARAGELATRTSIGATSARLVLQLLTEVGVLALIGAVLCLPVAGITLALINSMLPAQIADSLVLRLNAHALFAAVASLGAALLFGLVPALEFRGTGPDLARMMKGYSSQSFGGKRVTRMRAVLATGQVALSMVLLVLAGLFVQSLTKVAGVDLGMNADSLISFRADPGSSGYDGERAAVFESRVREALDAQPGVVGVAAASVAVLTGASRSEVISIPGYEDFPLDARRVQFNAVSPSFFDVLSIPILAGRSFSDGERASGQPVVVVNESFLHRFDLGAERDMVGTHLRLGDDESELVEIVGIAGDAKYSDVKENIPPQLFVPLRPEREDFVTGMSFYVRAGMASDALLRAVPNVVSSIAPDVPVSGLTTMRWQIEESVYVDRLIAALSSVFAGFATFLAAIGIYGVLAYSVTQRTREFGLRLALGAESYRLRMMIIRQVAVIAIVGGTVGLAAALALGRIVESLLFGLSVHDPAVLAAAVVVLGAAVLVAGWSPAQRAGRVAPMEALRYE